MESRKRQFLRPNEKEVAAKVMDGEAILINLLDGTYYSMDKTGAFVWERIGCGASVEAIAGDVAARYAAPPDTIRGDLEQLVAELLEQRLVVASHEADEALAAPGEAAAPASEKLPYEAPVLRVYRDMEDLLALDPPIPEQRIVWDDVEDEHAE